MFAGDPDVPRLASRTTIKPASRACKASWSRTAMPSGQIVRNKPTEFDRGHEIGQLIDDPQTKVLDDLKIIPAGRRSDWVNPDTQGARRGGPRIQAMLVLAWEPDATPGR